MKRGVMLAFAALSACSYSIEDIRRGPVVWTKTYDKPFETMADCLSSQSMNEYAVSPQIDQAAGQANVTLSYNGMSRPSPMGEYTVLRLSPTASEISWKHIGSHASAPGSLDLAAIARADLCGNGTKIVQRVDVVR
jgi:hypothetical protein